MEYLKSYIFKVHALAKGLFFGLMVTTAWMAYRVCESALGGSSSLPQVWETVLIVFAALVITYIIDNALYHNSVTALAQTIKHKGLWRLRKEGAITTIVLLCLMAGRFFFSGGATYLTGESTVTSKQTTSKNIELVQNLNSQKDNALSDIRAHYQKEADQILSDAKKEAQEIKETAKRLAEKKIESAIKQGSTTQQKAYHAKKWIEPSYSILIKKANREAYKMEEQAAKDAKAVMKEAKHRHKSMLSNMENALYKERNNSKWNQLETETMRTVNAQIMLWTAERWTYYLIDFILVVGSFFCSWLVAVYIVKTDATIETFFPDKPGLTDVIKDTLGSMYAYLVTVVAQIPAYFKKQTSLKMNEVAKSISSSSSLYSAAIGKYIVASHPEVNAHFGAVAYKNAMTEAKHRANKRIKPHPTENTNKTPSFAHRATVAQPSRNKLNDVAPVFEVDLRNNQALETNQSDLFKETPQPSRNTTETSETKQKSSIKKSGGSFRSYLSRAADYAAKGEVEETMKELNKALQALPDDHLKESRMKRIDSIKSIINEQ